MKWTGVTADSATRPQALALTLDPRSQSFPRTKGKVRLGGGAVRHPCTCANMWTKCYPASRFAHATVIWVSDATDQSCDFLATRGEKEIRLDRPWIFVTFCLLSCVSETHYPGRFAFHSQETKDASNKVLVGLSGDDRPKLLSWRRNWGRLWRVSQIFITENPICAELWKQPGHELLSLALFIIYHVSYVPHVHGDGLKANDFSPQGCKIIEKTVPEEF